MFQNTGSALRAPSRILSAWGVPWRIRQKRQAWFGRVPRLCRSVVCEASEVQPAKGRAEQDHHQSPIPRAVTARVRQVAHRTRRLCKHHPRSQTPPGNKNPSAESRGPKRGTEAQKAGTHPGEVQVAEDRRVERRRLADQAAGRYGRLEEACCRGARPAAARRRPEEARALSARRSAPAVPPCLLGDALHVALAFPPRRQYTRQRPQGFESAHLSQVKAIEAVTLAPEAKT